MSHINSQTQTPTGPDSPSPSPSPFSAILSNWHLPATSTDALLPPSIRPSSWTPQLLGALQDLSMLTVGQRSRAHSLLNTYFQERMRQASYRGSARRIYAVLEVEDVQKACQSVRRMSGGLALQGVYGGGGGGGGKGEGEGRDMEREEDMEKEKEKERRNIEPLNTVVETPGSAKRKYSIRNEVFASEDEEEGRRTKVPKLDLETPSTEPFSLLLTPTFFPAVQSPHETLFPTTPISPFLPPCSTLSASPLQRASLSLGLPYTPTVTPRASKLRHLPRLTTSIPASPQSPTIPQLPLPPQHLIQAAQQATHEFNVRRLELAEAEARVQEAEARAEEARWNMEGARLQMERDRAAVDGWGLWT